MSATSPASTRWATAPASAIHGGAGLEVRSDNSMPWGRYNADALPAGLGGQWLDSNDTQGMTGDTRN